MTVLPACIQNDLLEIAPRVCAAHFFISCNYEIAAKDTLNDSGVQTRPWILHFGVRKALLHKNGEAESDNLSFAVSMGFDESASRCVGHLEKETPGL